MNDSESRRRISVLAAPKAHAFHQSLFSVDQDGLDPALAGWIDEYLDRLACIERDASTASGVDSTRLLKELHASVRLTLECQPPTPARAGSERELVPLIADSLARLLSASNDGGGWSRAHVAVGRSWNQEENSEALEFIVHWDDPSELVRAYRNEHKRTHAKLDAKVSLLCVMSGLPACRWRLSASAREFSASPNTLHNLLESALDATSQFNLGLMYAEGKVVPQDDERAGMWFLKAAEQGHAAAQLAVGSMYDTRFQDYAQALVWYRKAAAQGNAHAQHNLGVVYRNGQGVPVDYAQAATWYRKAVEQGHADALYTLGVMQGPGLGVSKDG